MKSDDIDNGDVVGQMKRIGENKSEDTEDDSSFLSSPELRYLEGKSEAYSGLSAKIVGLERDSPGELSRMLRGLGHFKVKKIYKEGFERRFGPKSISRLHKARMPGGSNLSAISELAASPDLDLLYNPVSIQFTSSETARDYLPIYELIEKSFEAQKSHHAESRELSEKLLEAQEKIEKQNQKLNSTQQQIFEGQHELKDATDRIEKQNETIAKQNDNLEKQHVDLKGKQLRILELEERINKNQDHHAGKLESLGKQVQHTRLSYQKGTLLTFTFLTLLFAVNSMMAWLLGIQFVHPVFSTFGWIGSLTFLAMAVTNYCLTKRGMQR